MYIHSTAVKTRIFFAGRHFAIIYYKHVIFCRKKAKMNCVIHSVRQKLLKNVCVVITLVKHKPFQHLLKTVNFYQILKKLKPTNMNQQYKNIFLRPKELTFSFSGTSTSGKKLKHWVILLLNILKRKIYSVSKPTVPHMKRAYVNFT